MSSRGGLSSDESIARAKEMVNRRRFQFERLYRQLDPSERESVELAIEELRREGRKIGPPRIRRELLRNDFVRPPVGVREFVSNPKFLGLDGQVFPKLVDDLEELFEGEYVEVVLGGSIGWGKTRFMQLGVAYDLYCATCLKDPALAYGMMTGSNLTFVNASVNQTQATKVFFQDLRNLLLVSPYFHRFAPFDRTLKSEIRFLKNNIRCYPIAASEQAALGVGVFCACIDEANFMEVVERSKRTVPGGENVYDQVEAFYHKISSRMRSRMNVRGRMPGHLYISSSARYPGDFTERLEQRVREEEESGQHLTFARHYAQWETWPPGKFQKETFRVEVGDVTRRTRVLTGGESDVIEASVIEVPMDFKPEFDRDPDRAVRDIAGKSVLSIRPFISRREMIRAMFDRGKQAGLKHPYSRLDVTLQEKDPAMERLLPECLHWVRMPKRNAAGAQLLDGAGQPLMQDELFPALYHAHVDLAKNGDAAGLVIAHNFATVKIMRFDAGVGTDVEKSKPLIRIDLVLRIIAPKNGEIDIPRIRAIFYELNRTHKMQFGKITYDSFASQESVKTMKDQGFAAGIFSVDKETTAYETLRTAIYDQRVLCYRVPILERELVQLERGPKKIDHPPHGSKDLADALAGAVQHCEDGWRAGENSRGAFQIGIMERAGEPSGELKSSLERIHAKITNGQSLTGAEEDILMFGGR